MRIAQNVLAAGAAIAALAPPTEEQIVLEATDVLARVPDHIAIEPASPFYWSELEAMKSAPFALAVYLDGKRRDNDVIEFCRSEGWIRIHVKDGKGGWKSSRGRLLGIKIRGVVTLAMERRP